MSLHAATRLYIPPRTRLETVWRLPDASWHVYTACNDRGAPYAAMLGTALVLRADGSAERHTYRPDGTVDIIDVMPRI